MNQSPKTRKNLLSRKQSQAKATAGENIQKWGKMEAPKKQLNIEQAGNYIKEKNKTLAADVKKKVKDAPVSFALPKDRHKHLMYGISLLVDISETIKNRWCTLTGHSPGLYTTKEVCQILRKIIVLRINGYSLKQISHHLKVKEPVMQQSEALAVEAIKYAIEKKQNTSIPILGGV